MTDNQNTALPRKRVLLIAYYFHKKEMVASNRTHALFENLGKFGWDVTLLTSGEEAENTRDVHSANKILSVPHHPGFLKIYFKLSGKNSWGIILSNSKNKKSCSSASQMKVSSEKLNSVKQFISRHPCLNKIGMNLFSLCSLIYFPDLYCRWYRPALKRAVKELKHEHYDAVISTSGPFTAHKIASKIVRKYNLPWIADYRDLWSQREYATHQTTALRTNIESNFEKKTIKTAAHLSAVSAPIADTLRNEYGLPCDVILNGFSQNQCDINIRLREKFTITHLGNLYDGKRNPEPLIRALSELIQEGCVAKEDISVDFYGQIDNSLESIIHRYNLQNEVIQHGLVSKEESIYLQYSSQILLLLTVNSIAEAGVYTGKVFEYLASNRPILSLGYYGKCVLYDLMQETHAGFHPLCYDELKSQIYSWYLTWKKTGEVPSTSAAACIGKYNYQSMAESFSKILDKII